MSKHRLGGQTIKLKNPPCILSRATIVGKKEGEGPLGEFFDMVLQDDYFGENSWEKAECRMYQEAARLAISKAGKQAQDINYLFGGDLLNQIITANYAARSLSIPFFGLYGACSTLTESMSLASIAISGEYADLALCVTSSHFCTAERQYRYPLEMGNQRPPTAQWTVTGAGAFLLSNDDKSPYITYITTGKVIDYGITDTNNMGAAMAPAAAASIKAHFEDTRQGPDAYDLIVTGDLGSFGRELAIDLLKKDGYDISDRLIDCGCEIYSREQDVHAGASGCGCSAVVFGAYILKNLEEGRYKRILLLSTGALLSTTSIQQGESIPGIAHGIVIDMDRG
jgi:stage V sporulation protein AD